MPIMEEATVLVVGGGGREHALTMGLIKSPSVGEVHVAPGNAGTAHVATNHPFSASDTDALVGLAQSLGCDLVVVGPEGPLVDGLADNLRKVGVPCFGPHSEGAELEGSKLYAKQTMQNLGIPTGGIHNINSESQINAALDDFNPPWVVKRDVLAGGKGVVVTSDRDEAYDALAEGIISDGTKLWVANSGENTVSEIDINTLSENKHTVGSGPQKLANHNGDIYVSRTYYNSDWTIAYHGASKIDGTAVSINNYGSGHTESIVSQDKEAVDYFFSNLNSAIILNNASTQFADGGEFGMGAEIGIATDKIHARGPVGARQLTSYKYLIQGNGQTRPS